MEGIELGLKLKFGSEGLGILSEISVLQDVEQLRAILAGRSASNLLTLRLMSHEAASLLTRRLAASPAARMMGVFERRSINYAAWAWFNSFMKNHLHF